MGLHKPADRHFVILGGSVMTSGGSLNLAKGQFGVFNTKDVERTGAQAVNSFSGASANDEFEFRVGMADVVPTRSRTNKSAQSVPFKLSEVVGVRVSAPETTTEKVDDVVIGYNGREASTSMSFTKGDDKWIYLKLSGDPIGIMGYPDNEVVIPFLMSAEDCAADLRDCEECDKCAGADVAPILSTTIANMKAHTLRGMRKLTDFVDILPSTNEVLEESLTNYQFFSLQVNDTGDENALALVQAQYPTLKVVRTARAGSLSTYEVIDLATTGTPSDFTQTPASLLKGCEDCPANYTEVAGGLIYAITLEDGGTDDTANVQAMANAVANSATKQSQLDGVGLYTVVLTAEPTAAERATFMGNNPTATIDFVSTTEAFCTPDNSTAISWTDGDTCPVSERTFRITLADDECGNHILTKLQAFYPDYTVTREHVTATQKVTLAGGSTGQVDLLVNGQDYGVTFTTDVTTTAALFVSTHATAILAESGYVVTSEAGVITFTDTSQKPFVATTDEGGTYDGTVTVGAVSYTYNEAGCQNSYRLVKPTNLVCDECDTVFNDYFTTEAPEPYNNVAWTEVAPTVTTAGTLAGIRIRGKVLEVLPEDWLVDEMGTMNSSVRVEVSGGYISDVTVAGDSQDAPFPVTYLSRWQKRTHLGADLYEWEDRGAQYFLGESIPSSNMKKILSGMTSSIKADAQYIDYVVTLERNIFSQSFGGRTTETTNVHLLVESGYQANVESLVNKVAAAAGKSPVFAYGGA